jgi:hypothetical protein
MEPGGGDCALADNEIIEGRIIHGIKIFKEHLGCSLHEALGAFTARYDVLRCERPGDFSKDHATYWENFYS